MNVSKLSLRKGENRLTHTEKSDHGKGKHGSGIYLTAIGGIPYFIKAVRLPRNRAKDGIENVIRKIFKKKWERGRETQNDPMLNFQ